MEPSLKKLFDLRMQESDLICFKSEQYGRMSLLLAQTMRHKDQPRVLLAIGQRLDETRAGLNSIADQYHRIYETTSLEDTKKLRKPLKNQREII